MSNNPKAPYLTSREIQDIRKPHLDGKRQSASANQAEIVNYARALLDAHTAKYNLGSNYIVHTKFSGPSDIVPGTFDIKLFESGVVQFIDPNDANYVLLYAPGVYEYIERKSEVHFIGIADGDIIRIWNEVNGFDTKNSDKFYLQLIQNATWENVKK